MKIKESIISIEKNRGVFFHFITSFNYYIISSIYFFSFLTVIAKSIKKQIKATIDRANEIDFLVFACADTVAEAKAIAQLHPDIINPEPTELIGGSGGGVSDMSYVMEVIREIRKIDDKILIEQAAGITNGKQVYDFIMAGSEAAGAASGIMNAADPIAMIDEMIGAVRQAADDLKKINE